MKPYWEDAPDWANWLAMNKDGTWTWFESRPSIDEGSDTWRSSFGSNFEADYYGDQQFDYIVNWWNTLKSRYDDGDDQGVWRKIK